MLEGQTDYVCPPTQEHKVKQFMFDETCALFHRPPRSRSPKKNGYVCPPTPGCLNWDNFSRKSPVQSPPPRTKQKKKKNPTKKGWKGANSPPTQEGLSQTKFMFDQNGPLLPPAPGPGPEGVSRIRSRKRLAPSPSPASHN